MTQCQKSWQGQHSVTCLNCGGSVAKVFLWCFGCVFVEFVVVILCFCDGVVVFLWWRGCVFVVVFLCFCGCVFVFL